MAGRPFKVNIDALDELAQDVTRVSDHFQQVSDKNYPFAGYSDEQPVEDGLSTFFNGQTDNLHELHAQLDKLGKTLQAAADAYRSAEQQIAQSYATGS